MTPDQWERVKEIFYAALAEAPAGRAAFVQSNCGNDTAIRSEVERLLAEHERASGFLERPPSGSDRFALSGSKITGTEAPLIGQNISHYQIVAKLGEGGMGIVYRAFDTQLRRPVAIKVLTHSALANPESNRRFLREARAASALNHPNIAHVYDVGEADRMHFIVMEHIDGRTLGALIREGPLDFARVLELCLQSADAIAEAHEHGIIHRDIKPSNMMITPRDQLKILDFGLAKVDSKSRDEEPGFNDPSLTSPGVVMGTTRYMSPEQALGHDVDQRTDIFSLGVVFYEMVAGHPAFTGRTITETMDRVLHSEPEPLSALRSGTPAELERIIRKCLEKDRDKRYPSARELQAELLQLRGVPPARFRWRMDRRKFVFTAASAGIAGVATIVGVEFLGTFQGSAWADSIAVLPFVNTGSDPDLEYLSDGIAEGLINDLSQLPRLRVIARPTVFTFKGKPLDLGGISRALQVRTVLTGKVSERGQSLNVQADLVDVKDGSQLWGQQYDRTRSEIADVQRQIFDETIRKLRITLAAGQQARTHQTENSEAYQLYLKGRYQLNQYAPEAWMRALDYFQAAIRIDPGYARAWTGLADTYYQMSSLVLLPSDAMPKARTAAVRALEFDERLAEAHASLGVIKAQYDWDGAGAEREFKRAIELNPSYSTAHQWYGILLHDHARFDEAIAELNRAQELDPLSLFVGVTAAWPLHYRGQYDKALKQIQKVLDMYPKDAGLLNYLHSIRADSYLERGLEKEAAEEFIQSEATACDWCIGGSPEALAALKAANQASGLRGFWQKNLELQEEKYRRESEKARAEGKYVTSVHLARLYSRLGYKDKAFAQLESGVENRDENMLFVKPESIRSVSPWASIRSDPRFGDLLRRMGLEP